MLHRSGIERSAHLLHDRLARVAIVAEYAHLDELVRLECHVDLVQHGRGETVLPDRDDGIEVVRAGAQGAPRGGIERGHADSLTFAT